MVLQMTLDEIKDRVPSSVKLIPDDDTNSIDVIVDHIYSGYLYVSPEGVYFKTWMRLINWDDYHRVNSFLKRFKFELLINIRANMSDYQIYRLIE